MKRTVPRFLAFLAIVVVTGAAAISIVPIIVDPSASLQVSIPLAIGVLFVTSAVMAWRVRPQRTKRPYSPPSSPPVGGTIDE